MGFDVLVVEDSPAMRSFITSTIESIDGVRVTGVESGFEALKELRYLVPYSFSSIMLLICSTSIFSPRFESLSLAGAGAKIPVPAISCGAVRVMPTMAIL